MTRIVYTVVATLPSQPIADEYVLWLKDGHVDQVVNGGAHAAMIARLEPDTAGKPRVMTQYIFQSRANFDRYLLHHAPGLRAEGLKKFGPERGVAMQRMVGEIV